jgi:hypothetical protein
VAFGRLTQDDPVVREARFERWCEVELQDRRKLPFFFTHSDGRIAPAASWNSDDDDEG